MKSKETEYRKGQDAKKKYDKVVKKMTQKIYSLEQELKEKVSIFL